MEKNDISSYEDIISLPHHVSVSHPHMLLQDRAAQFAPFAALTGHDAAVKETARLTQERRDLDEGIKSILDEKLRNILDILPEKQPHITVTYFCPDERKTGGAYVTVTGKVKKIDCYEHSIVMTDNRQIPIEEVYGIEFLTEGMNM